MTDRLDGLKAALEGRYEIQTELGRGGMAIVYRARDIRHDRDVAIKVLRGKVAAALGAERFLREIRIEAKLQHPNIVSLHDSGEADGVLYYVMPLVEGESLRDHLAREGQLPLESALQIASEVADALAYAHRQGFVHRDIKPGNILLSSGHAVVTDFGIARAIAEVGSHKLTQTGVAMGTPEYMSPEQAGGGESVDGRSDIYSLGCLLYEMLVGEPPFSGRTPQAVIARHMSERLPSIAVVRPDLPRGILATVEKSLAKVPADRFSTADEFLEALEKPEPLAPAGSPPLRRAIQILAAIGAIGLAGWWFLLRAPPVALDSNRIVVFPLAERGLPVAETGAGYLAALKIEAALDYAQPLKWIDGWERLDSLTAANPRLLTPETAGAISRARSARYYIRGDVARERDSTTVFLRLHDAAADAVVRNVVAAARTGESTIYQLAIDAVVSLLPALVDPGRTIDLTPLRNRDPAAVALWLRGERQYRLSQFEPALAEYRRALDQDSALAFAAFKGAQAASWLNDHQQATELIAQALRFDLLPVKHARFARGIQAYLAGQADSALSWLEGALDEDPEWAEAQMALGEVYYHLLPRRVGLDSLAETAFRAAVAADTGFTPPLIHLSEIASRTGRVAEARAMIDLLESANADSSALKHLLLMADCVERGPDQLPWADAVREGAVAVWQAARWLSGGGMQADCATAGFRAILEYADPDAVGLRWSSFLYLQGLLVAGGEFAEAAALVDSVAITFDQALSLYVLDTWAGAPMESRAPEMARLARSRFGPTHDGTFRGSPMGPGSRWLIAIWHSYLGEPEGIADLRESTSSIADTATEARTARRARLFERALTGHLALARGDTSEAISRFRALGSTGTRSDLENRFEEPLAVERYLLAQLLLARGEYQEAYAVAAIFDHPAPVIFLPFLPASLSIRLQAAGGLRRPDLEAEMRERLLRLGRGDLLD